LACYYQLQVHQLLSRKMYVVMRKYKMQVSNSNIKALAPRALG